MTKGGLVIDCIGKKDVVSLFTYHTGMDIHKWIKRAPRLFASTHYYYRDKSGAADALRWDGTIADWLFDPSSLAALIIASAPGTLIPVANFPEYFSSTEAHSLVVDATAEEWLIHSPYEDCADEIVKPYELFVSAYPDANVDIRQWPYCLACRFKHFPNCDCRVID